MSWLYHFSTVMERIYVLSLLFHRFVLQSSHSMLFDMLFFLIPTRLTGTESYLKISGSTFVTYIFWPWFSSLLCRILNNTNSTWDKFACEWLQLFDQCHCVPSLPGRNIIGPSPGIWKKPEAAKRPSNFDIIKDMVILF